MLRLPERPGPWAGAPELLNYIADMADFLGGSVMTLSQTQRAIMASIAELQTALDANTAATAAAAVAINSEIADLAAALSLVVPGQPVTQAQLDQLNAGTAALQAAVAALTADDAPAP